MGLSYHYSFRAPASLRAAALVDFLQGVEGDARMMGFAPTIVFEGCFDTPERIEFARRVLRPLTVEDTRLCDVALPARLCWSHIPSAGVCRVAPVQGSLLVITDEKRRESVFGFCRYPDIIHDEHGTEIMRVPEADDWLFSNFVDSPDPRYRAIVRRFRAAGFAESELDEFAPASSP